MISNGVIYNFINNVNGKRYIGQTVNERQRYIQHISDVSNENSPNYNLPLSRAIRKYGIDNFTYEVLEENLSYEQMNELETVYIEHFNSIDNGYNLLLDGKNCPRPKNEEYRRKISLSEGSLTEEEVIELRIAYSNHESPTKIYNNKYKDKFHKQAFMNIWCGKRYSTIMPEVFDSDKKRSVKYTEEIVRNIRQDKIDNPNITYKALGEKYNIPKATIADIIKKRTWKHVQ